jgi:hypothetical protein
LVGFQNFPNQKHGKPKLRLAKVRAKSVGMHLVECQDMAAALFSPVRLKKFLVTCQHFGHKHWYAVCNFLAMNQLIAKLFSHSLILAGHVLEPEQAGPKW